MLLGMCLATSRTDVAKPYDTTVDLLQWLRVIAVYETNRTNRNRKPIRFAQSTNGWR